MQYRNKSAPQPIIDWGVACLASPGQSVSGDAHLVEPIANGMLMAVVDGLGHGDEAAAASKTAIVTLRRHATLPLDSLVAHCHAELMKTRGAVMTLAAINALEGLLTWVGVGNIVGILLRANTKTNNPGEYVLLRSGLVGYQLPQIQCSKIKLAPHDLLVLATDGIAEGFVNDVVLNDSPQLIADKILSRHYQGHDDALVLVGRYLGNSYE